MVDLNDAKNIRMVQMVLGIEPTTVQLHDLHTDIWIIVLGYMKWRWIRYTCTSSMTMWNIGNQFHSHTLEGPILQYLREYRMAFIPSIRFRIKVDTDTSKNLCVNQPKHGCYKALRCCAFTMNGSPCMNTTQWDGCYGPLCGAHRGSLGIVVDGGQYKSLDCEWY